MSHPVFVLGSAGQCTYACISRMSLITTFLKGKVKEGQKWGKAKRQSKLMIQRDLAEVTQLA